MANRELRGRIQRPVVKLNRDDTGQILPADLDRMGDLLQQSLSIISGGISFGDGSPSSIAGNLFAQYIPYNFVTPGNIYTIPHGLRKKPAGYVIVNRDRVCCVYDPNMGAGWGPNYLALTCDTANASVNILVF